MQNTRQKILETANQLFIKKGYTATSIREIAQETGIGKATIYHHFSDKESIAGALLKIVSDKMMNNLKTISMVSDPIERLKVAATFSLDALINSAEIFQIVRREIPSFKQEFSERMTLFFSSYTSLIKESLEMGMETGLFRKTDAGESARIFLSMLQGSFASTYITGVKPKSTEKLVESLLDVFLNGMRFRN